MLITVRKCLQWTVSNWRLKLKFIVVAVLLGMILHQHLELQRLSQANIALGLEKKRAAAAISEVVTGLQQMNSSVGMEVSGHILALDSTAVLLGGSAGGGAGHGSSEVCGEKYSGNNDWPLQYNNWKLEDCQHGKQLSQLVSLVMLGGDRDQVERVTQSLWSYYPGVSVVLRTSGQFEVAGVTSVNKDASMAEVAGLEASGRPPTSSHPFRST